MSESPRPTSEEVAEVFAEHGLDSREYREALSCHFGSCYHPSHQTEVHLQWLAELKKRDA